MKIKEKSYRKLKKQMDREFDAKIFVKHEFSENYQMKKEKLIGSLCHLDIARITNIDKTMGTNKNRKYSVIKKAVIPAAAVAICTTSVFAASQFGKSSISDKKVGDYQVELTLYKDSDVEVQGENESGAQGNGKENSNVKIADKNERYIKLNMNYLPNGMKERGANYGEGKYGGESGNLVVRVFDMNVIDNQIQFDEYSVKDVAHIDINGDEAILIEAYDAIYELLGVESYEGAMSKHMYVYYKEAETVVDLWATTGISNDELVKIAENISFSEGTEDDCTHFEIWSQIDFSHTQLAGVPVTNDTIDKKYVDIYGTGDSFETLGDVSVDNETGDIIYRYLNYEVKDIKVSDQLEPFGYTYLDESDIKESVDENGNVNPDRILYIKRGDGIFTLSSIVEDKTVDMKVVYVTIDITNNSEEDYDNITLLPNLTKLEKKGDNYVIKDWSTGLPVNVGSTLYDGVYHTSKLLRGEAIYDNFSTAERKNHIDIKSGETRTIQLAYCVDESDIDELYITPDIYGGQCEFREVEPEENYQYIKIAQ